jgi:hypothetical protein
MFLACRRPRRLNVPMPKRYQDLLPESAPMLPPPSPSPCLDTDAEMNANTAPHLDTDPSSFRVRVRHIIRTPRNIFGLVRQYFAEQLPSIDPEEHITLADLSPSAVNGSPIESRSTWLPFPNRNSFLLGNWYWNGGLQKSQSEFKDLLNIIGDPSFSSDDVRRTKWSKIFAKLGDSNADGDEVDVDGEWLDVDAGWKKTHVEITVPFHRRMKNPGTSQFVGAELYHRSLVDVIRERISDPHTATQIHLEPYELLWKRSDRHGEEKMHGEIYTSEAFREAHDTLQNSPAEPNCDLPRVIVALMFWSDATHLTQFGNSQLWPCYVTIGNESKYRRCKPSCNLCSHVAYFQKVSKPQTWLLVFFLIQPCSYRTNLDTLQPNALVGKAPKNHF